jgi:L-glyceraldehyde 3-phosphate reductase
VLERATGVGAIVFSPLAQGLLTDRYLTASRRTRACVAARLLLRRAAQRGEPRAVRALNEIAARRGQSLAQLAIAWALRDPRVTSALIGASSVAQLEQNVAALAQAES